MAGRKDGRDLKRAQDMEDRLIRIIDKRDLTGKNRENVDDVYRSYRIEDGERVWSF